MDTLRWIILIIGILVLAGIYLLGRRGERRKRGYADDAEQYDPRFEDGSDDAHVQERHGLDLSRSAADSGEDDWLDDVRPLYRQTADREPSAPLIASREEDPSYRQVPPLEVDEPPVGLASGHEASAPATRHQEEVPGEGGWIDDVRPLHAETVGQEPPAPFIARRDEDPSHRQAPPLEVDEPPVGLAPGHDATDLKASHQEEEPDQDGWIDDVRPVHRQTVDGEASAPFIVKRDEDPSHRQAPPLEVDEPPVGSVPGHDSIDLKANHEEEVPDEDGWIDDVRPLRRDSAEEDQDQAVSFSARRDEDRAPDSAQFAASPYDAEPDEDGWIDDVRPIKRSASSDSEREARDVGQRDIPERVVSTLSVSEEEERRRTGAEPERPHDVLIIHVVPPPAVGYFRGEDLGRAFKTFGLTFGPTGIYHREAGAGAPMFSVVSRVQPGTFDPEHFAGTQMPGFSLFLQLPGPDQPMVAFRAMSDCARRIAERLGGRLQDEDGKSMTAQTLSRYEKRVRSYISGLSRRISEAAEADEDEDATRPPSHGLRRVETTVTELTHGGDNAPDAQRHAMPEQTGTTRDLFAEDDEATLGDRAGAMTRKLFGLYEERVRSFVSGLSQRSMEADDESPDVLMNERVRPRETRQERPDTEVPEALSGSPSPSTPAPDGSIPPPDGASATAVPDDEPERAVQAETKQHRSLVERAASTRKKPRKRDKPPVAHATPEPEMPEELLVIHIIADPAVGAFGGEDLAAAFEACDLSYGAMQIYHRETSSGTPMFSVVNMLKPGTFDPEHFADLQTPGISLFMQLPGPEQPMVAFRNMRDCARRLVEHLGGRLEDETHSTMTLQTLSHYEERVRSFIQHHARRTGGRRV